MNWQFQIQILFKSKILSVVFCQSQNNPSTVFVSWGKIDISNKQPWKQTKVNLCSILGSEHYNKEHFKDFKISTISIKCNEKLGYKVKCKIPNQMNKLPGTIYSTGESIALGYTFIKHCTTTTIGKEKGWGLWKSPQFL